MRKIFIEMKTTKDRIEMIDWKGGNIEREDLEKGVEVAQNHYTATVKKI